MRFAALTELEELAAKWITSGPDRRFDSSGDPEAAARRLDEPDEAREAKVGLALACKAIETDTGADDLLRLKAADVRAYLGSDLE